MKMAARAIASFITTSILPVISLWNNLTSAVEINMALTSLDETIGEDKIYKLMTKMIAYVDKKQREKYIFDNLNLFWLLMY